MPATTPSFATGWQRSFASNAKKDLGTIDRVVKSRGFGSFDLRRTFGSRPLRGRLGKTMLGPGQCPACSDGSTFIGLPAKEVAMTPNIHAIIRQHVTLEVRCIDRLYLHAYMPKLARDLSRHLRTPDR
jgi:hypothetical protein